MEDSFSRTLVLLNTKLILRLTGACLTAYLTIFSPPAAAAGTLTPDEARQDTQVLKRTLLALHPALTKYRTEAEINAAFTRFDTRGAAARTATDMYLAASELAAAIRCGHTWTNVLNQSGLVKSALLTSANKLPFTMTLIEGRWLVLESSDAAVHRHDEVLAINGVRAPEMVAMLMPYLRADGSSDGKRLVQLNHDRADRSQMDILWPLLSPPQDGSYRIDLRRKSGATETVTVKATTLATRESLVQKPQRQDWALAISDNIATMTLPNFSFWNSKFAWSEWIDAAFTEMRAKGVKTLIIDIRGNEGGDGAIGGKLLSHLVTAPLRYVSRQSVSTYERAPYNLMRYLDTWDYRFFDRTGLVEKITSGTANGKFSLIDPRGGERVIEPARERFSGRTFLLVGAENSSATFQLALLAQQSGVVTLVGQRTGGNLRGLNGGQLAWVTLPHSGVAVDIPLLAAHFEANTPDTSVTPDILVERTFAARVAGRDLEREAVGKLLGATR